MTWKELGITNYPQYLKSRWWKHLNEKYIYSNPKAECWICTQKVRLYWNGRDESSNLLLHHVSYKNLGRERYLVDLFILCHNCHEQVHFWFFGEIKTPLAPGPLLRRMFYLKGIKSFQRGKIIPSSLYLLLSALY